MLKQLGCNRMKYIKIHLILELILVLTLGLFREAIADQKDKAISFKHFRDCDFCSEMVVLPAGSYLMGAKKDEFEGENRDQFRTRYLSETPQHVVQIKSFAIAKVDVTKEQFAIFARETKFEGKGCRKLYKGIFSTTLIVDMNADWNNPGFQQTNQDPVVCISWHDAKKYINWLNQKLTNKTTGIYRLPTEEEWEYAARAGTTTRMYWGDSSAKQCQYENGKDISADNTDKEVPMINCRDGYSETSPVGSFKANPWGLYDMLGNVSKWMTNCERYDYSNGTSNLAQYSPKENCEKHELRGGSWKTSPLAIRAAARGALLSDSREQNVGLRLVLDFN